VKPLPPDAQTGPPAGRVPALLREALLDALAVMLPVTCAGCGADDRALCSGCRLRLAPTPALRRLGDGTEVASALAYEGVARRAIIALKEQGRTDVGRALAVPLAAAISAALSLPLGPLPPAPLGPLGPPGPPPPPGLLGPLGPIEFATVPASRSAFRRRGFDPVGLLVRRAGFGRATSVLVNVRDHASQKSLDRQSRGTNLAGSMAARGPLHGRRFLVIDDVVTTGATLLEATRALRSEGAQVLAAATLASTPRHWLGLS
jgi:predicted amidophosphoribosyltransferase